MNRNRMRRGLVTTRQAVRTITTLNDAPWRWRHGVHAGLATGLPVVIFTIIGQQALGLMASLGGFTVLYCADRSIKERLVALPIIGFGLVIASFMGVTCAHNEWLTIACLILVTSLAVVYTIGIELGPPGPLMFILVAGVSAHLAAPVRLGGLAVSNLLIPMLVAGGAVVAYLVVFMLSLFPLTRIVNEESVNARLSGKVSFTPLAISMAIRIVLTVAIVSIISKPLGVYRSYWVIVAAVAVLQGGNNSKVTTTVRAFERVLGTLLGVIAFELLAFTKPSGLWVVFIIAFLQFATQVVIARNYVLALIFITPIALLSSTIEHLNQSGVTVQGRIIDTLSGATIAMLVFWAGEVVNSMILQRDATGDKSPARETINDASQ